MKKFLKVFLIIILILIILVLLTPILFKGTIITRAKQAINENVNAEVEFADLSVSLIKGFPNLSLTIDDLYVKGIDDFDADTLIKFESFYVEMDLISAIKMENIKVKNISLIKPVITARVTHAGKANWDIVKETEEEEVIDTTESEPMDISVNLKKFEIIDAYLYYTDDTAKMSAALEDFDFTLTGDLAADFSMLDLKGSIQEVTFKQSGVAYLNDALFTVDMTIDADLVNSYYVFKDNSVGLNEILLSFNGDFAMPGNDVEMDIQFNTNKTEFKSLLSLVPVIYRTEFESIETEGTLALDGSIKGVYNEESMPSANLNLLVENGMFHYPDLPKRAQDIHIDVDVFYDGLTPDNTTVDVNKFHVELGGNPIDFSMNLKTPVSDPNVNATLKANLDLATLQELVPIEDTKMQGIVAANVDVMGQMSSIENEKYNEFKADGSIRMSEFQYASPDFPAPLSINEMQMTFSPQFVELKSLRGGMGQSDFSFSGTLVDFMPYIFADETIKGQFSFRSNYMNINEFMPEGETQEETPENDTAPLQVIEVPRNLHFILNTNISTLLYDDLTIKNIKGELEVLEGKVLMDNLSMNMLEGSLLMAGEYNTQDITNPTVDFKLDIRNFDIPSAFEAFTVIEEMVPIAKKATGRFSAGLTFNSLLDDNMSPVLPTVMGSGELSSQNITIENASAFNKLSEKLNYNKFQSFSLKDLDLAFEIKDGRIYVEPFETQVGAADMIIAGDQGIDQTMNYIVSMSIPRSELGGAANNIISGLTSKAAESGLNISPGETINLDALIGGTVTDPTISLNLKESLGTAAEALRDQAETVVREKIEETTEDVKEEVKDKVNEEAQKLIQQAEKEAAQIKSAAEKAAEAVRKEANDKANLIMKEAEGKPKFARDIAKKSADKLRAEGEDKAADIIREANNKADAVIDKARAEAAKLE